MARSCEDDFETVERLGAGSFGTVYKVRRKVDGEFYVIKTVRIADMSYEEQVSAINEVKLMSQMDHDNVVRYYDSFLTKENLHIVMEFCNKGDVQRLLKKAKSKGLNGLQEPLIWNISLQIMLGLYYIHRKKILHRDLKTANVFLEKKSGSEQYCAKIGDLGVAKLLETSTAFAQTIIGTPYYLSPELCADQPYRDRSDCWALGVIIYECCTLDRPFDARNQCALILKIIQCPAPSITANRDLSPALERMVNWLLEKDPNKRPNVKMLLCEKIVQEKLKANNFQLPEELEEEPVTNKLNPEAEPTPVGSSTNKSMQQSSSSSTFRKSSSRNVAVLPSKTSSSQSSHAKVRGDRVRGGRNRVTSSAAMERHQVRTTSTHSASPAGSRLSNAPTTPGQDEAKNVRPGGSKRPSMNIVDDSTIETLETNMGNRDVKSVERRSSNKRMVGADPSSDEKVSMSRGEVGEGVYEDAKASQVAPSQSNDPVNYDDDVDEVVEDWYEEDFEDDCAELPDARASIGGEDGDADCKSAQESMAVMRLQSFAVKKPSSDVGLAPIRNSDAKTDAKEADIEPLSDGGNKDEWDLDPVILEGLIEEYRDKSLSLLGEEIFKQVYNLCSQFMLSEVDEGAGNKAEVKMASSALLHDLEKTICEHLNAGIDVACEVVFNVKLLLALESRYEEYMRSKN